MSKKQEIDLLAERSSGAYSYPAYRNWRGVCAMLLRRGFSPREANAILLSKWTRWAGDGSKTRRYGNYTSTDLAAFLDCMGHEEAKKEAAQMADETPSDYDTPEVSEIDRLRATNAELLAALKDALRYVEVQHAYRGAMTAAEVEKAILANSSVAEVRIGANSCNTLAAFDLFKARAAIAKAQAQ